MKKLAKKLRGLSVYRVYCSDLKRAVQSAQLIFDGMALRQIPELREMNFGVFEGMRYSEITKRYPDIAVRFTEDPFKTVIPKGERPGDFRKRVLKTFRKIVSLGRGKTSVIVTHGGPIRVILNEIQKPESIWDIIVPPASAHIIEISGSLRNTRYAIRGTDSGKKGGSRCLK